MKLVLAMAGIIAAGTCSGPAHSAEACPKDHSCVVLPHATLAVPDAYIRPALPRRGAPGHFDKNVSYFAFWMPDGAPAGAADGDKPHMMCPTCIAQPLNDKSKIFVVVTILPPDDITGDPDRIVRINVVRNNYGAAHGNKYSQAVPAGADVPITSSAKAGVDNINWIIQLKATHEVFVRAGCDETLCRLHAEQHWHLKNPYPPYVVMSGPAEIKGIGLRMFVESIHIDDAGTFAEFETLNKLINRWRIEQ